MSWVYVAIFLPQTAPCLRAPVCGHGLETHGSRDRSNGQTKKLTVGILQLSAEVTHYVVPAKEPAAYLQAKVRGDNRGLVVGSFQLRARHHTAQPSLLETAVDKITPPRPPAITCNIISLLS